MAAAVVPAADRTTFIPISELHKATDGFAFAIGISDTGGVFRGKLMQTPVAVKLFRLPADASTADHDALRKLVTNELHAYHQLQHSALVRLLAHSVDPKPDSGPPFALVFELLEYGMLADWLVGPNGEPPVRTRAAALAAGAGAGAGAAAAGAGAGGGAARCALSALERVDILLNLAAAIAYLHGHEDRGDVGGGAAGAAAAAAPGGAAAGAAGAADDAAGGIVGAVVAPVEAAVAAAAAGGAGAAAAGGAGAAAAGGAGAAAARRRTALLHRDIKPANVGLALAADGTLIPKLLDLGCARALPVAAPVGAGAGAGAAAAGAILPATVGAVVGTPGYIAWEMPESGASVQTDIFSLGATMLDVFMGRIMSPADKWALLAAVEGLGEEQGGKFIASHADPAVVWPPGAAAAFAHAIVRCTRHRPLHRADSAAAAAALLREVRRILDPASAVVECWACYGTKKMSEVLSCPAPDAPAAGAGAGAGAEPLDPLTAHHLCFPCLETRIGAMTAASIALAGARFICAWPGCTHPARSIYELAPSVRPATLLAYMKKQDSVIAGMDAQRAAESRKREKLALCLWGTGGASFDQRVAAGAALVQDAMTLRCPRCAMPYVDIVNCNAATCEAVGAAAAGAGLGCGACFCAVCNREFPDTTACHDHVAEVHAGGRLQYYNDAQKKAAQKERRAAACIETVATLSAAPDGAAVQLAVAAAVGNAVLADVGLTQATLLERASASPAMAATAVVGSQFAPAIVGELRKAAANKFRSDVKTLCETVRQLCLYKDGAAALFLAAGAPAALLDALRQCADDALACSAAISASLTLANRGGGGVRALVRVEAVPLIVAALTKHSSSELCTRTAANAVGEAAAADADCKQAVVDAGAVHALLAALRKHKDHQPNAARTTILALGAIAADDTGKQEYLMRAGTVILLVDTLKRHPKSPDVCEAVCETLRHISHAAINKATMIRDVEEKLLTSVRAHHNLGSKAHHSATQMLEWVQANK